MVREEISQSHKQARAHGLAVEAHVRRVGIAAGAPAGDSWSSLIAELVESVAGGIAQPAPLTLLECRSFS